MIPYSRGCARRMVAVLLCACGVFARTAPASAQGGSHTTVTEVLLTGNRSVSDQLIRSQLRVRPGRPYDASAVQRDIRRLFELGYFSDIKADVRETGAGVTVEYIFTERKIIRDVVIVGNRYVRDEDLEAFVKIRAGETYIPGSYERDQENIVALYRQRGFAAASVDVRVREISPTEVELIYTVNEGLKVRVRRITILGNAAVSERTLRRAMKTRPPILRLFGGMYHDEVFRQDLTRLLDEYANHGRIDAQIEETRVEFVPPKNNRVDLTIVVTEGPEYVVDRIAVDGNQVYDAGPLLGLTRSVVGQTYNKSQVETDSGEIEAHYSDRGYILSTVTPRLDIDRAQHTIGVTHSVQERELMYVGRILVRGNVKTKDEVIRRELSIHPGDRFDGTKLRASRDRVMRTDYFTEVQITTEPTDAPNHRDLVYLVEEQRTGQFNFGAGFSTNDAVVGQVSVSQSNFDITNPPTFTGAGQRLVATAAPGTVFSSYRLSFTEPYLWGNPVSGGFDLFLLNREFRQYDQDTMGFSLRLGKRLTDFTRASVGYTYQTVDIDDVDLDAPQVIRDEEGSTTKSSISLGYVTDTRDSIRFPSRGYLHRGSIEFAGLGGDSEFTKLQQESTYFWPVPWREEWTFMVRVEEGIAFEHGDEDTVPLFDRFFAGGSGTVRGYEFREVGPRVLGDPIGGELLLDGTFELGIPLFPIVRWFTWFDWGQVWSEPGDFPDPEPNTSIGLGIGLITPLGPMRFDYGIPLNADDDQGNGKFHVSTGFSF